MEMGRGIVILILVWFTGCGFQDESQLSANRTRPATRVIADRVKSTLTPISSRQFLAMMKAFYQRGRLMNDQGTFEIEELAAISEELLPETMKMAQVNDFIDEIASHIEDNPYVMEFLTEALQASFPSLESIYSKEGAEVIPKIVAWAMVLEKVTKAQLDHPELIGIMSDYWIAERKRQGINFRKMGFFGAVKLVSMEEPIQQIATFHSIGEVDPKFLRGMLPLNIGEAITADWVMGYHDNALAGWPLLKNSPGQKFHPLLGTGPATFTSDGKRMEVRLPLPKQWADLYQGWNLAFISQIEDYLYWLPKLLIPQVSHYQDCPEEYIYRRALALYIAKHFTLFGSRQDQVKGVPFSNWADQDLTRLWGKINRRAAKKYQAEVDRLNGL